MRNRITSIVITLFHLSSAVRSLAVPSNIAVVGCGVLGTSLCEQLLSSSEFESTAVTAITKTKNNHKSILERIGSSNPNFHLVTFDEISKEERFTNVVFCAPPSGFEDYPGAVASAADNLWSGDGLFLFTSSGGIYGPGDGETVNETSPLPDPNHASPRSMRLVKAEENVLGRKGGVLRLAGLYTLERGAHNYWLEKGDGTVRGSRDGIINLLHYDDAAGACVAALKAGKDVVDGNVFLISDGNPTTRGGICESALKSKRYHAMKMPTFGEAEASMKGKIYDGKWSNQALHWAPTHSSFDQFMENSQ